MKNQRLVGVRSMLFGAAVLGVVVGPVTAADGLIPDAVRVGGPVHPAGGWSGQVGAWGCSIDAPSMFGDGTAGARGAQVLRFDVAPGLSWVAAREERDLGLGDTPVWFGNIVDDAGGYALVVNRGGAICGKVQTGAGRMYVFEAGAGGAGVVREIDLGITPTCAGQVEVGDRHAVAAALQRGARPDDPGPGAERGIPVVDIGVFYTPSARNQAGSAAAIESQIALAVADANAAYQNSGTGTAMFLAGVEEVAYIEGSSLSDDLNLFRGLADGVMDGVHARREVLGADLMALITTTQDPQFCGLAAIIRDPYFALAEASAFSVTTRPCLFNLIFAHEIGHNMGCAHDRANVVGNGGEGSYPFSFGAGGTPYVNDSEGATAELFLRLGRATSSTVSSDWYSAQGLSHGPALGV